MGIIVVNTDDPGGLMGMSADGTQRKPAIPTVMVSRESGVLLLRAIRENAHSRRELTAALSYEPPLPVRRKDKQQAPSSSADGSPEEKQQAPGSGADGSPVSRDIAAAPEACGATDSGISEPSGSLGSGAQEGGMEQVGASSPLEETDQADTCSDIAGPKDSASIGESLSPPPGDGAPGVAAESGKSDGSTGPKGDAEAGAEAQCVPEAAPSIPEPPQPPQPRLDMLVPTSSHPFVVANMIQRRVAALLLCHCLSA